ncbi:MAG TPA: GldG family protein [Candidatus Limnocylindria bacterium]|nr:GldG family protein [Candidatus Limnocylindria bacterium]
MARPPLTAGAQWVRLAAALPALVGIFIFGQLVLDARGWRADLTPERRYTLSPRAREVLRDLDVDVRALAFLRSMDPRNVPIRDLLTQVTAVTPRIEVEMLDLNRAPALAREYEVYGVGVVLEAGGRRRLVSNPTEDSLLAGLLAVTRPTPRRLAWVVGHGEGDIESTERQTGFARLRRVLGEEQYVVRPTTLGTAGIPDDTDAVVIAGPKQDFLPEELAVLNGYLQQPGRALIMLDPLKAPELARSLSRYQVALDEEIVVDPSGRLHGGEWLTMRLVTGERSHPIVAPLTADPLFSRVRPVRTGTPEEAGTIVAEPFLFTSRESWSTPDTSALRQGSATFVEGRDQRGPVPVGVAVTFPGLREPGMLERRGRLVVLGDSDFANNFFLDYLGNKDLVLNAIAWVSEDEAAMTHRPERAIPGVNQFYVTDEQGDRIFWQTVILQPAVFLVVGLVLAARRRWG